MLAWRIALRYLFSKKSHSAVNIISIISVAGVAVATAAIVIVLSIFNGFQVLSETHLSAIDPQLKVVPTAGKAFSDADSIIAEIMSVGGVASAVPVIEERGLLIYADNQMPVIFKGVPDNYADVVDLDGVIIDGGAEQEAFDKPAMLLSVGVAVQTNSRPGSIASLYVPRRVGRINPANPSAAFRGTELIATGVTQVNQQEYDTDYVFIPLESARDLLEYTSQATAIEIALVPGANSSDVAKSLNAKLKGAKALTRAQQEEHSFKIIMIEKWVTFLMLAFILIIASFNIISTLSLLVIEKRDNMVTLRALGAPKRLVTDIFVCQGWLISVAGGTIGIILGTLLSLAQQWGKLIKLAGDPNQLTITYYPVRVLPSDLLVVLALVAVVALISSQATRLFNKN